MFLCNPNETLLLQYKRNVLISQEVNKKLLLQKLLLHLLVNILAKALLFVSRNDYQLKINDLRSVLFLTGAQ